MIRTVLTNVLLVGLEWKGLRCHRRASPSTVKNIKIENPEKYKEKTNSIVRKKNTKKKHSKSKGKYNENNTKHRAENREAMRQTQEKDTKETKIK